MVVSNRSEYEAFKEMIIEKLTEHRSQEYIINISLKHFEKTIGSQRSCEIIKQSYDLKKLFEILEFRDELSEDNIQAIKKIAQLIDCYAVDFYISQYEKIHPRADHCVCGNSYRPENEPNESSEIQEVPLKVHLNQRSLLDEEVELDGAIKRIAPRVGSKWTDIARSLGLDEYDIEEIRDENPRLNDKIHKMFQRWKENGNKANVQILREALHHSRRRDLADRI